VKSLAKPLQGIILAGGLLFATSLLAVVVNSFGYGFHLDYTISRYVGLETWSALLFGLGNVVVAWFSWKFLLWIQAECEIPKWLMVILAGIFIVGLLGVSVCPMGYFDEPGTTYGSSVPSFIHNRCSRVMFFSMLMLIVVVATKLKMEGWLKVATAVYVVYGLICVVMFLAKMSWFNGLILIFESSYIFGFFGVCLGCGSEINKRIKEKNGRTKAIK